MNQNSTSHGYIPFRPGAMKQQTFDRLSSFIYKEVGIKLTLAKKTMLEARLQKRLRLLRLPDHEAYCDYLFSQEGMQDELVHLIDAVTTNTTDFFREPRHFEMLSQEILPSWFRQQEPGRLLNIWSAGCATGMEPYTLAMVLTEFAKAHKGFVFSIMASDISSRALETAGRGVYDEERVKTVPAAMKKAYLMRSKDRAKHLVRVVPEIRRVVRFVRLNFMDNFQFNSPMDIIFCRNVIIYFDRETQEVLFRKLCRQLIVGGHLFIGHSESLTGMELPLKQLAPTVYQRI